MNRILLVEDDPGILKNLCEYLRAEGFEPATARGQREALNRLREAKFDLVLLDISLADGNGFSVCADIKRNFSVPVIFLTASDDEYSTVTGLDMGAEDYITKPFRPRELVSRINRVLRRSGGQAATAELGGLRIDTAKGTVTKNGSEIFLSALEYRLLLIFLNHRGTVLTRTRLLAELWDAAGEFVNDNTLTVYIKRLREKTEDDPQNPVIIKTVRGIGYKAD